MDLDQLKNALESGNEKIIIQALTEIGRDRPPGLIDQVRVLTEHENIAVRYRAGRTLRALESFTSPGPASPRITEPLHTSMQPPSSPAAVPAQTRTGSINPGTMLQTPFQGATAPPLTTFMVDLKPADLRNLPLFEPWTEGPEKYSDQEAKVVFTAAQEISPSTCIELDHWFRILSSHTGNCCNWADGIFFLLRSTSSRLSATHWSEMIVMEQEEAHRFFWLGIRSLLSRKEFQAIFDLKPERTSALLLLLQHRLLHFIRNNRYSPFRDLLFFLSDIQQFVPEHATSVNLNSLLSRIPSLVPTTGPADWLHDFKHPTANTPVHEELTTEINSLLSRNNLMESLLTAVRTSSGLELARTTANCYMESLISVLSEKGSTPVENPLAFADQLCITTLLPPTAHCSLPAIVLYYLQPEDRPSQIPEKFKGECMDAFVESTDTSIEVVVRNQNFEGQINGGRCAFMVGLLENLEPFSQGLRASKGRYLITAVPLNQPGIGRLVECRGSVDTTGQYSVGLQRLYAGRSAEGIKALQTAANADPELTGPYRMIGLEVRNAGTTFATRDARRWFQMELDRNPDEHMTLSSLGITAKREKNWKEAFELFKRSYDSHRWYVDNLLTWAATLYDPEDQDLLLQAHTLLAMAWDINPEHAGTKQLISNLDSKELQTLLKTGILDSKLH